RPGLARDARGAEEVLDRDRDAAQRTAAGYRRCVLGDPDVGVEGVGGRALAVEGEVLGGVEVAGLDGVGRLLGGELDHEAPGLGTRKPPRAASGALSSARSTGIEGRGSSARRAFSTSMTCEVGGTS